MKAAIASARSWLTAQRAVVVVAVVAVGVALVAIYWQPTGAGKVGEHVTGSVVSGGEDNRYTAPMPFGEVGLRVHSSDAAYIDGERRRSDGTSRWVEVTWSVRPARAVQDLVWPGATAKERQEPASRLELVAGGRTYPLAEHLRTGDADGATMFRVADGADIHPRVVSDGVVQRAEQIETPESSPATRPVRECDATDEDDDEDDQHSHLDPQITCSVDATRSRYLAGLGWAPRGQAWLMVRASAFSTTSASTGDDVVAAWESGETPDRRRVQYRARGRASVTLTVDGSGKPAHTDGRTEIRGSRVTLRTAAFLVPADRDVAVHLTYRVQGEAVRSTDPRPADAPKHPSITTRETISLENR